MKGSTKQECLAVSSPTCIYTVCMLRFKIMHRSISARMVGDGCGECFLRENFLPGIDTNSKEGGTLLLILRGEMLVNNSYIGACFIQNTYILKTLFKAPKHVDGLRVYNRLKIKTSINNAHVYVTVYMYF